MQTGIYSRNIFTAAYVHTLVLVAEVGCVLWGCEYVNVPLVERVMEFITHTSTGGPRWAVSYGGVTVSM